MCIRDSGDRAADSQLTMEQLYKSPAVLLIGNDPTNQNPFVAWQIRTGIRHHQSKLFILNAREIKLHRQATQFVKVAEGEELAAIRWMGREEGSLAPELVEKLVQLKAALEEESEVAIVFGAEISGAAIAELVALGSKLPGKVRYMALGDYANSRGAADMGVLPDRLPGYAYVDNCLLYTSSACTAAPPSSITSRPSAPFRRSCSKAAKNTPAAARRKMAARACSASRVMSTNRASTKSLSG